MVKLNRMFLELSPMLSVTPAEQAEFEFYLKQKKAPGIEAYHAYSLFPVMNELCRLILAKVNISGLWHMGYFAFMRQFHSVSQSKFSDATKMTMATDAASAWVAKGLDNSVIALMLQAFCIPVNLDKAPFAAEDGLTCPAVVATQGQSLEAHEAPAPSSKRALDIQEGPFPADLEI